jgi:hypothetical protein
LGGPDQVQPIIKPLEIAGALDVGPQRFQLAQRRKELGNPGVGCLGAASDQGVDSQMAAIELLDGPANLGAGVAAKNAPAPVGPESVYAGHPATDSRE